MEGHSPSCVKFFIGSVFGGDTELPCIRKATRQIASLPLTARQGRRKGQTLMLLEWGSHASTRALQPKYGKAKSYVTHVYVNRCLSSLEQQGSAEYVLFLSTR